ncbi:MAG TPA: M56 family metallopeptidase [Longimicrobiaceae bacterium]|nr:M56 family metallopeptidase [Longimicrobiaceae bacterium]
MTVSWLLYGLTVGGLIAGSAMLFEMALRMRGISTRLIWIIALIGTAVLTGTAPLRSAWTTPADSEAVASGTTISPEALDAALQRGSAVLMPWSAALDWRTLALIWAAGSLALLMVLGATIIRARRLRRAWPGQRLQGVDVRVSPGTGPLVAGVLKPDIVVPRWLLDAPEREQRLVIAHEREHVRGRDPQVLTLGLFLVALLPWSPASWWMLARLRLAVELDCDRRVVRAGTDRAEYLSTLLDVAERRTGRLSLAPAFLEGPTQLERRLVNMTNRKPRFALARGLAMTVAAGALVLTACEASMPTSTELEQMDVTALEKTAVKFRLIEMDGDVTYVIDGQPATSAQAEALPAEKIATVNIKKVSGDGAESEISIWTKEGAAAAGVDVAADLPTHVTVLTKDGTESPVEGFAGILVVDGVIVDASVMKTIDSDNIESIEVIKGAAAAKLYDSPNAKNGVIQIRTKG